MRYDYATYVSSLAAHRALEHMFAAGEVSPGERPLIERRGPVGNRRFVITLAGE